MHQNFVIKFGKHLMSNYNYLEDNFSSLPDSLLRWINSKAELDIRRSRTIEFVG
jgi:hypothetical protein